MTTNFHLQRSHAYQTMRQLDIIILVGSLCRVTGAVCQSHQHVHVAASVRIENATVRAIRVEIPAIDVFQRLITSLSMCLQMFDNIRQADKQNVKTNTRRQYHAGDDEINQCSIIHFIGVSARIRAIISRSTNRRVNL